MELRPSTQPAMRPISQPVPNDATSVSTRSTPTACTGSRRSQSGTRHASIGQDRVEDSVGTSYRGLELRRPEERVVVEPPSQDSSGNAGGMREGSEDVLPAKETVREEIEPCLLLHTDEVGEVLSV